MVRRAVIVPVEVGILFYYFFVLCVSDYTWLLKCSTLILFRMFTREYVAQLVVKIVPVTISLWQQGFMVPKN